jgi:hypothetical protein
MGVSKSGVPTSRNKEFSFRDGKADKNTRAIPSCMRNSLICIGVLTKELIIPHFNCVQEWGVLLCFVMRAAQN